MDEAISKQLQLYRDHRIQDTTRGGHITTNETSWMLCPQTYGGIDLNMTMPLVNPNTGGMAPKNNLRRPAGSTPLLAAPSEWRSEHHDRPGFEFAQKDAYLLLLVPSTSVTWGQDDQKSSGDYSYEGDEDSGWVEIGCEMMHVRRVPDVEFRDLI